MRTSDEIAEFLTAAVRWCVAQDDILALGLLGSYARDAATEESDIDLILLTTAPQKRLAQRDWLQQFGSIVRWQVEEYGMVTSLRVWYADGREVEFGIALPQWAEPPLDEGTRAVVKGGLKVLFERKPLLSILLSAGQ
jgi:predicted nucleotidyltransferase